MPRARIKKKQNCLVSTRTKTKPALWGLYLGVYPGSASGPGWSRSSPVSAALALCLCAFWTFSSCVGRCWTAARRRRTCCREGSLSSERWGPTPSSPPWEVQKTPRCCAAGTGDWDFPGRGCWFYRNPVWPVRQCSRGWRSSEDRWCRILRERVTVEANTALRVFVFWGSDSWTSLWATVVSVKTEKGEKQLAEIYMWLLLICNLIFDSKVL